MTRIYEAPIQTGVRILILGAGHYPYAQKTQPRVPKLADIGSATQSAVEFAIKSLTDWSTLFPAPIRSIDLLASDAAEPDGLVFKCPGRNDVKVDAPTMANILKARKDWLDGLAPSDILIFYCCGHGIGNPTIGRTFLASDFGADPDVVWTGAVALDQFIEGLADKAARQQWFIIDACANAPPDALRRARPAANPLVEPTDGLKGKMILAHGDLAQATLATSTLGAKAYGRLNGRSRFMDAFIEACEGSGFDKQTATGDWELSLRGIEAAISTYGQRVASPKDIGYYAYAKFATSDAEKPPILMRRADPPPCTVLVSSDPANRLTTCTLGLFKRTGKIHGQAPPAAVSPFRQTVEAFEEYSVQADWPAPVPPVASRWLRAVPPLLEFKV